MYEQKTKEFEKINKKNDQLDEFILLFDKVKKKIDQLDENEAKSILKIIYANIVTAKTGNGGDAMVKEIVDNIFNIYQKLLEVMDKNKDMNPNNEKS